MRQGILAFGPRAVLPENPNVGAAIISGSIPQPSKGEELVEDVGLKGRRDLDNYKRAECGSIPVACLALPLANVLSARTCIQSLCCLWTSPFYLYRN